MDDSNNKKKKNNKSYYLIWSGVAFVIFLFIFMVVFYFISSGKSTSEGGAENNSNIKNPITSKEGVLKTNQMIKAFFEKSVGLNNPMICDQLPSPFSESCKFNFYSQYALKTGDVNVCFRLQNNRLSCVITFALYKEDISSIKGDVEQYCEPLSVYDEERDLCYLYLSEAFDTDFCSEIWDKDIKEECNRYFSNFSISSDDEYLMEAINDQDDRKCYMIENESKRNACLSLVK